MGEQPPILYPDRGIETPNKRHATVEGGWQVLIGRQTTKVSNIYNNWGTLVVMSPRRMRAIWNRQCKYMIEGGLLRTSSEAKPSLTHSRDSWEIHPTSKQTDGTNESLFGPDCLTGVNSHMRHGEMLRSLCTESEI